jgi:MerR family transcriptional regulator, heat shock protein HspR
MSDWFDDPQSEAVYYTLEVTTQLTRLGPTVIERCVQVGLVQPPRPASEAARYSAADIARLRKVRRLIYELGLNWAGIEIVMRLTDELQALRAELARKE